MIIIILFLLPLLGIIHILVSSGRKNVTSYLSLAYSIITIAVSCYIWYNYDSSINIGLQYVTPIFTSGLYTIELGLDGLSLVFILLTTFTIPLCVLASWSNLPGSNETKTYFHVILLSFEAFTNLVWLSTDLFLFYIAFEAVLVPLFLIIGIFSTGKVAEKTRAAFLLFLYTFTGSLFILLSFSALAYYTGTSSISILSTLDLDKTLQMYVWLGIFISFAIKTPLVPFHNWILRAHVEANVAGSIVLAGLTLKIATYGILRILLPILPDATYIFAPFANTLAIISIIYASLAAIRQTDIKCLVAYSSVAHIGVSVLGVFSNTVIGITGGILLSIAHGFVSPALFFIVGGVLYDRFHTRTIKYIRGLTLYIPLAISMFFIFTLANIGFPLSANWLGELYSLIGAFIFNPYLGVIGATTIFFSACYSIWLYNRIAFGTYNPYLTFTTDLTRREFTVLLTLAIPILLLGVYPNFIITDLYSSVYTLLYTHSS